MVIDLDFIVIIVGLCASLSSILFAYLAFRNKDKESQKTFGRTEGVMFSDIGYIKACVDRVEKNLNQVDERYKNILERLSKVEEAVSQVSKRVDEVYQIE